MKKVRTFRKGEATSPPLTNKEGPPSDGRGGVHYELSPMAKTHGNFDVPTKHKIDARQRREMDRKL